MKNEPSQFDCHDDPITDEEYRELCRKEQEEIDRERKYAIIPDNTEIYEMKSPHVINYPEYQRLFLVRDGRRFLSADLFSSAPECAFFFDAVNDFAERLHLHEHVYYSTDYLGEKFPNRLQWVIRHGRLREAIRRL